MHRRVATFKITKTQDEWLSAEKIRTGNTYASILRRLIQKALEDDNNDFSK